MERQRVAQARATEQAEAFPSKIEKSIDSLIAKLPARAEGHDKGPYLSEGGEQMNAWLVSAVAEQTKLVKVAPSVKSAGVNLVVVPFMNRVEQARQEGELRNRDYRRLMSHALSYASMDAAMLKSLEARFAKSEHFAREITEQSEYFLTSYGKKQRDETARMAESYQLLVQGLALERE